MKQIIQYQKSGEMMVADLADPVLREGGMLVANHYSLISAGTERTSVQTAQASMLAKARMRPDLVKQVMSNVRREGLMPTVRKVRTRLDNYKELGYSSAGVVIASSVDEFRPGDRVACAGAGFASHAETVFIPRLLAARVPERVSLSDAAYTTVGAIALQGVRQAEVTLGSFVVVIGLGLIGLITVQLLRAAGCRVVGLDVNDANFKLAKEFGCDACFISDSSAVRKVRAWTRGNGSDAVLITAGTSSNQPLEISLEMARKRSAVVVVGAVSMNVPRSPFYEKELELKISCSYGPGRYDPAYELHGQDYPVGYVRWTENRNMESFLDQLDSGGVRLSKLTTHTFPVDEGLKAYDLITGRTRQRSLGVLIQYPGQRERQTRIAFAFPEQRGVHGPVGLGVIGAGNFAQSSLLPHLDTAVFTRKGVANASPVSARSAGQKFGFSYATADPKEILDDPSVGAVVIATRHDSHARLVTDAVGRGLHVFVEKPLAITEEELQKVAKAMQGRKGPVGHLLVGFNRRFSPAIASMRSFLEDAGDPVIALYRVNAGSIPKTHWVQDPAQGGRIVGEVCHFVDTLEYLVGSEPVSVFARSLSGSGVDGVNADNVSVTIGYRNGSVGTILYTANGGASLSKEYCEVHAGQRSAVMDNFRSVIQYGVSGKRKQSFDGSKGHKEEMQHFSDLCAGRATPAISVESLFRTTRVTFAIHVSLASGSPVQVGA